MSARTRAVETDSVDSRVSSGIASLTEKNHSIDRETNTDIKVDHYSDQQSFPGSASSTRPTSPVPSTRLWESAAHGSVCFEETAAGKALQITLYGNSLNFQPLKAVPDWTRLIHTALTESRPIMPFQQMYQPLSQEDMDYIRTRLEEYTDKMRRQTCKLDSFDCAVILEDARTLFSYIALLESTIKTQQTETSSKKRTMRSAGPVCQESRGKRQRHH